MKYLMCKKHVCPIKVPSVVSRPLHVAASLVFLVAVSGLLFVGCSKDMAQQDRFKTEKQAPLPEIAGTIANQTLNGSGGLAVRPSVSVQLPAGGRPAMTAASLETLQHGKVRFNIHCAPCHDQAGLGQGMVVLRGFQRPPSLVDVAKSENDPVKLFKIASDGIGSMAGYRNFITTEDRWAIVAYIQLLQLSHQMPEKYLEKEDRVKLAQDGGANQ
jgi:mono/diheme cytochrome c family protein